MSARVISVSDRASLVIGAAVGSVVRNVIYDAWPTGLPLLVSSVVATVVVFVAFPVVHGVSGVSALRYFVAGSCLTVASLSAYGLYGIWQTPWLALGFVVLPTASAVVGLLAGSAIVDALGRTNRRDDEVAR